MAAISILMPVYNGQQFLRPAIESILGQTFANFEFLILDDGSTDDSVAIIRSYNDERIRLHQLEHHGLIPTLNHGVRHTTAEWIARMDCDDVALPNRFERQLRFMVKNRDVVALGGAADIIDCYGCSTGVRSTPPNIHSRLVANLTFQRHGPGLLHPTVVMRTESVRRIGGYRKEFPVCEDADLWLRLAGLGRLASLAEPVLLLRKHGGNISLVRNQISVEGAVAAAVSHAVRERVLTDPVDAAPEAWAACRARIHNNIGELMCLNTVRHRFAERIRTRAAPQILSALCSLVLHPADFRLFWSRKIYRALVEHLSDELVATIKQNAVSHVAGDRGRIS